MMRRLAIIMVALASAALGAAAVAQEFKAGQLTVVAPWARATPGGAKVAGAYLEIRAPAGVEDKLLSARSPVAAVVELHDHINEGGVMRMRRIESIPIKGAKSVVLKPGGLHVMLMDLKGPLVAGQQIEITLVFEKAGEVTIKVPVAPVGAAAPGGKSGGAGAGHGGHKGH
jgi:hypothetical protein